MKRYVKSKKTAKSSTGSLSLTSIFRVSSEKLSDDKIKVKVYNPSAKYSTIETMARDDDPDEIAEYILDDSDLGIEKTRENLADLANFIEDLWY